MFHIHIGAHKVGSTSLQRFFALNAGLLEELGVNYAEVGFGSAAHHPLAKAFTGSKHIEERAELKAALAALAATSPDKTFLLSSEVFEFARPEGIREIAEAITPHKAQILYYVRDFTRMIPSKYAQRTKTGGNHKNFDDFLNIAHEMRWLAFSKLVSNWAAEFGWEAMRVQVLDRETLVGGDLLRDAWAALGLPPEAFDRCDPKSLEPVNTSPNWVALEAVRAVNRHLSKAELGLPKDEKTKGIHRTKAMEEARFAVEGLRVGKLLSVCEEATAAVGLADRPGQYLTVEQWATLHGLFRKEIDRVNRRLPGPPVVAPVAHPPPERTFLPDLSVLTQQEQRRLGRRVLQSRPIKRLPPSVIAAIGSAFDVRPRGNRRPAVGIVEGVQRTVQRSLGLAAPPKRGRQKELAEARAARKASAAAGAERGASDAGADRDQTRKPTIARRIQRRFARWARRLRGEQRGAGTTG